MPSVAGPYIHGVVNPHLFRQWLRTTPIDLDDVSDESFRLAVEQAGLKDELRSIKENSSINRIKTSDEILARIAAVGFIVIMDINEYVSWRQDVETQVERLLNLATTRKKYSVTQNNWLQTLRRVTRYDDWVIDIVNRIKNL